MRVGSQPDGLAGVVTELGLAVMARVAGVAVVEVVAVVVMVSVVVLCLMLVVVVSPDASVVAVVVGIFSSHDVFVSSIAR